MEKTLYKIQRAERTSSKAAGKYSRMGWYLTVLAREVDSMDFQFAGSSSAVLDELPHRGAVPFTS